MANELDEILEPLGTRHFLCTWHLSKNLFANITPTTGSKWSEIESMWWRIAKETAMGSREAFDEEWTLLIKLLPEVDESNAIRKKKSLI